MASRTHLTSLVVVCQSRSPFFRSEHVGQLAPRLVHLEELLLVGSQVDGVSIQAAVQETRRLASLALEGCSDMQPSILPGLVPSLRGSFQTLILSLPDLWQKNGFFAHLGSLI